jgi:F0F1-type ATP synthase epsilon subunit
MIKFENGLVKISGKGIDILSEYAVITHEIKEMFVKNGGEEKEIKEQLRHSFEHGLMNEEEFDKEIKETSKQIDAIIPFISLLEEMLKTFGAKDKEN